MGSVNYMQRVGHSSCVRCEFETSDEMSFEEQDAAMMAHLAEKHPDWQTDGGASILKKRLPGGNAEVAMRAVMRTVSDYTSQMDKEELAQFASSLTTYALRLKEEFADFRKVGSTVHAPGCECSFCKMGSTRA